MGYLLLSPDSVPRSVMDGLQDRPPPERCDNLPARNRPKPSGALLVHRSQMNRPKPCPSELRLKSTTRLISHTTTLVARPSLVRLSAQRSPPELVLGTWFTHPCVAHPPFFFRPSFYYCDSKEKGNNSATNLLPGTRARGIPSDSISGTRSPDTAMLLLAIMLDRC